jgi:hypothetical protein
MVAALPWHPTAPGAASQLDKRPHIGVIAHYLGAAVYPETMRHLSKAGAVFILLAGLISVVMRAALGPRWRNWVPLFALACTALYYLMVPILPTDWTRAR